MLTPIHLHAIDHNWTLCRIGSYMYTSVILSSPFYYTLFMIVHVYGLLNFEGLPDDSIPVLWSYICMACCFRLTQGTLQIHPTSQLINTVYDDMVKCLKYMIT